MLDDGEGRGLSEHAARVLNALKDRIQNLREAVPKTCRLDLLSGLQERLWKRTLEDEVEDFCDSLNALMEEDFGLGWSERLALRKALFEYIGELWDETAKEMSE